LLALANSTVRFLARLAPDTGHHANRTLNSVSPPQAFILIFPTRQRRLGRRSMPNCQHRFVATFRYY